MANPIQVAPLPSSNFVDSTSRYNGSTVLYYGTQKFLTFETYKKKVPLVSPNDRFYMVTKGTEYRPDLVANRAYGVPSLWWQILEANNLKDVWEFKSGLTVRLPNSVL